METPPQIPNQTAPTPGPMPDAPLSPKSSKTLIAAVIAALVVATAGYAVFANRTGHWPFRTTGPSEHPLVSETPYVPPDIISGHVRGLYANAALGFQVRIPDALFGQTTSTGPDNIILDIGRTASLDFSNSLVRLSANKGANAVETPKTCGDPMFETYTAQGQAQIGGITVMKCTGLTHEDGSAYPDAVLLQFVSPTMPTVSFAVEALHYSGENARIIDQVLSTFLFTPRGSTYTNTQYGFSFLYPSDWTASLDGNTVFIDNGIENTSNVEPDPRWLQMQVLLPPDSTKSVTDGYEHRYYGPIEGWELVSNEFGSDSLSVILKLSVDSYFSVGVYGAFVQQRAAVDSLFSTFTLTK